MKIVDIIKALEQLAPPAYQESYDNAGLIIGDGQWECHGVLCCLDATEEVVLEARSAGCNLVITHHPIVFGGLKKINGNNYVERTVIAAIKKDIAIYAIHTNLDNVIDGVNDRIADQLHLVERKILVPKQGQLSKLYTYAPVSAVEKIKSALFEAGAGSIGNYSECSFEVTGTGNFKGNASSHPSIGRPEQRESIEEVKMEFLFPSFRSKALVQALKASHPYEEAAYEIIALNNENQTVGSGIIGKTPVPTEENDFLTLLKKQFGLSVIRHSPLTGKSISKVAICGGAGAGFIRNALAAGADIYITGDLKYHEFFDADGRMLLADIGHWESEQFTTDLLIDILQAKFPTFAVLKSAIKTNPVNYFL